MEETDYLKSKESILDRLRTVPFLKSFNKQNLDKLLAASKIRNYQADEIIIPEGAYDKWVYVLLSGAVNIFKQGERIATLDHSGDIFGELAMIDNVNSRSASVYARTKTYCLAIDVSTLDAMSPEERCGIYTVVYRIFSELLAERLRRTSKELAELKAEVMQLRKRVR